MARSATSSTLIEDAQWIGLDVHQGPIFVAVRDSGGNLVIAATPETKAESILERRCGIPGNLHVSFAGGACAAWLHTPLKPHAGKALVGDPRKHAFWKVGNKNDREDALKLAERLFLSKRNPVYHRETGIRTLQEPARSCLTTTGRLRREMNRLKTIYRSSGDCWCRPTTMG